MQSHYFQIDYGAGNAITELDGAKVRDVDWDQVKSVAWFPKQNSDLQVALIVDREPGYRVFIRMEGMLTLRKSGKGNTLIPNQKKYAFYIGLYPDDGTEYAKEVEKATAKTVAHINWAGGFKVFMPPDGQITAVGNFDLDEEQIEVAGKVVQFLHFKTKAE